MVPKIQMFVITSRAADPEMEFLEINLKVHKREKFFVSYFEFFTILKLVKLKN
jgi:hypothetical protein